MKPFIFVALSGLLLSGCNLAPGFARPYFDFLNTNHYQNQPSEEFEKNRMSQWWSRIDHPQLQSDIQTLLANNLSLKQGQERIRQAQENTIVVGGSKKPSLSLDGSANRSFAGSSVTDSRTYTNSFSAAFATSWQMDLFGKIENQTSSARNLEFASIYDQEALKHSLIASLVEKHIAVDIYQKRYDLAQKNVRNRQQFLNFVRRRYNAGVGSVNTGDLLNAQSNLDLAKVDVKNIEQSLLETQYDIDVLLAQKIGTTALLDASAMNFPKNIDVAQCLPASLLDRRPDLKASELRLKASNANIGIAMADLYPSVSIGGSLGFNSDGDGQFFTADHLAGSLLSNITTRLFEGGALRANIRMKESEAKEQSYAYAELALNAIKEVETTLSNDQKLKEQIKSQEKALKSMKRSEKFAKTRYEDGLQTLENYLNIQQQRYTNEQQLYQLYQARWNNRIALYLALGGDWFGDKEELSSCEKEVKS